MTIDKHFGHQFNLGLLRLALKAYQLLTNLFPNKFLKNVMNLTSVRKDGRYKLKSILLPFNHRNKVMFYSKYCTIHFTVQVLEEIKYTML